MYSDPNAELDSPPPRSQFRRPWSPEALQSGPGTGGWRNMHMNAQSDRGHHSSQGTSSGRMQQRREASDVSVEALDLADYARTLRARQTEDPYPPFPTQVAQPKARYPPSAFPYIPQLATSKDSIAMHPPSLVSPGPTFSSLGTHHTSSSSAPSYARRAARRPYSLPPTPNNSSQGSSSRGRPGYQHRQSRQGPYIVDPDVHPSTDEIDVSNFPKWSRGWYSSNSSGNHPSRFAAEVDDIYTPIPQPHFNSTKKKSPFDPGYVHDPYNPYDSPPPLSSIGHESSRDLLPWSMDPPEYGPPLDPMLKEERMRMLEREFGKNGNKGRGRESGLVLDDNGEPVVGTVNEKGNLVTSGPKRRILFRVLQIVLAAGACVPAIYAAVAIKPLDPKDPPPPANKPPVFVLYILSSLTLILLFYLFLIRPCCIVRKPKSATNPLMNKGMMVLPVTAPGGKKPWKGGKKGKGKYGAAGGSVGPGDVQVNLIVDPKAFQPPGTDDLDDDDDEDDDSLDEGSGMMPGGYGYEERERARRKKKRRNRRRKGVVEGLKMEEEWKVARSWAKKMTAIDVGEMILWGAAFVFIMIGERCPSGGYQGWCDAYNLSTACACLLSVAFAVSLFFDVQDLFASKVSPRTRN